MRIVTVQVNERELKRLKIRALRKLFPRMARRHDARAREWYKQQVSRTPAADAVRKADTIHEATLLAFTSQKVNNSDGPWHTGMIQEAKRMRKQADEVEGQFMHDTAIFWGEAL